jgi:hypothetical protein
MSAYKRQKSRTPLPLQSVSTPKVTAPKSIVHGGQRHVLRATPSGKIFWAPFNHIQDAATQSAIKQIVSRKNNWK